MEVKNTTMALCLLGAFAGAAQAQTNVSIYGITDLALVSERGGPAGSVMKLSSGVFNGSRLGFRGSEDLGGGLSARFVLESGVAVDTGGLNQGGLMFGRQAYVGMDGSFGSVSFGRQYSPHFLALDSMDPFTLGMAGAAQNLFTAPAGRVNNAITYQTPALNGLGAHFLYGLGEVAGNSSGNRHYGIWLRYGSGPAHIGLAHHDVADTSGSLHTRSTLLVGKYDFGVARLSLGYNINKATTGTNNTDALIGVSVPAGQGAFLASYIQKNDKTAANRNASQVAVGYLYELSKRTTLYTAYGKIDNDNGAGYTVGNALDPGTGNKALNLGIRHRF